MCQELCGRYFPCNTCFLNRNNFVLLIGLTEEQVKNYKTLITKMLLHIREALYNYFSVSLLMSFGTPAADELETAASFSRARADLFQLHPEQPLVFSDLENTSVSTMTFDFRPFQSSLRQILDEFQFPCSRRPYVR